ncbi:MAG: hypothetical protein ABGY29_03145 [bacterium]
MTLRTGFSNRLHPAPDNPYPTDQEGQCETDHQHAHADQEADRRHKELDTAEDRLESRRQSHDGQGHGPCRKLQTEYYGPDREQGSDLPH